MRVEASPYTRVQDQFLLPVIIQSSVINEDALSDLRQFLATERPLKMMKTDFYFTVKALFVLEIFQFLLGIFDHVGKWRD